MRDAKTNGTHKKGNEKCLKKSIYAKKKKLIYEKNVNYTNIFQVLER